MTYERITLDLTLHGSEPALAPAPAPAPAPATPPAAAAGAGDWTRADFRIHAREFARVHWLVRHPLGRDLLVGKLQQMHPELKVPIYRTPAAFEPLLNDMVDALGMRDWAEPSGVLANAKAVAFLLRCAWAEGTGQAMPDWRAI